MFKDVGCVEGESLLNSPLFPYKEYVN